MPQLSDVFLEQLYARKKTVREYSLQAAIFVATLAISAILFTFCANFIPMFGVITGTFAIFIVVYFGYKNFMKLNVEFEYIYLNGELDVDRILSRSERSRLVTVKSQNFEQFGVFDESMNFPNIQKKIDVRSNTSATLYFAIFNHREFKKTLLIFEPDERILTDLKKYIPKSSWK